MVTYVKDFSFAPSPPRPTARGYARGGHVNQAPKGQVAMTSPNVRNPKDASSPGSPNRSPPSQSASNMGASKAKFAQEGKGTPPATKQTGNVERMAGWSDFAEGGSAHRPGCGCSMCGGGRIGNLGKFAHGGKVVSGGEKSSGTASKSPQKAASAGEVKSGTAKMAMGGMSRGTNPKKNAAIHAKAKSRGMPGAKSQGLAKVVGALEGASMPKQGPQAPPGMAPGMGAPPGQPMGAMAPQMPSMGQPTMAQGGALHVVHHVMR